MTDTVRVAALGEVDLDELLLEAKLAIPHPRDGFVSRSDLIIRARDSNRPVVAVSAPSGYGKSSLLSQWAAVEERPVAWLTLDHYDDDPALLLALLATAFVRAVGSDPSLIADMRGHGTSVLGRAAPRLAAALRTSSTPFVMIIDDLHEVGSPACHDALSVVIAGLPEGSQLVAASRVEQPHVPRLRASGETIEFGASDLALDVAGTQHIFAEANVELSVEDAEAVTQRTEGWPVGLYLAATIAHDSTSDAIALTGDDRYVADYLYRESMAGLPDRLQVFLRRTAVLDQFCADLCDSVLEGPGSQGCLRELESSNVFLIPLDRRRGWYRYHQLFREFLEAELRQTEPELVAPLHTRAADWYESHGSPAMAIEHLLVTSERDRCVQLVAESTLSVYQAGQLETVRRWIRALGDDAVAAYPPLAVLAGWIAVMSGRAGEAEMWADSIVEASFDLPPVDGTASFASARAMLLSMMCAQGPARAMADATFGVEAEPVTSLWRDQAIYIAGEMHYLLGDVDTAERLFAEASELTTTTGNHDVQIVSDAERAMIAMDRGRWVEAARLVEATVASVRDHHLDDYAISVVAFAAAARLALHRGDLTATTMELTKAMRARQYCTTAVPSLAVRVRLWLAKTFVAMGDQASARHLMRETEDILNHRPALGSLVQDVSEFRDIIDSSATELAGAAPLTPAELRLLPYLQTHLTIPEIGARLFVSRNTVSTEVGSIYRKLGVSSRNSAVDRALAIGLLGA